MTTASLLSFALAAVVVEATPGPNMAYLALVAASEGRRAGFAAVLGVALGLLLVGLAAAFGLAALIAGSPILYQLLLWGGVGYFLWLAWDTWRDAAPQGGKTGEPEGQARYFRRGLITNLLNPKAAIFYIAVLPAFVDPARDLQGQTLLLALVYVGIATIIHGGIVVLAGSAHGLLADPARERLLRRAFAAALAGIALWLGLSL